ncbi:MAG: transporter substrate-binding domain-containing protein [Clostridiales Family XIII bacterium]|nr:transporter substrate-binding domain-containing protein [Clostridiales Family XIII bacterium]
MRYFRVIAIVLVLVFTALFALSFLTSGVAWAESSETSEYESAGDGEKLGHNVETGASKAEKPEWDSIADIPGVTAEDVKAVEKILSKQRDFTYGMVESSETMEGQNSEIEGYTALICDWLSELFGANFVASIYEWEELFSGIEVGTIDFSGDITETEIRRKNLFFSTPIANRPLMTAMLKGSKPLSELAAERIVNFGFFENSVAFLTAEPELYENYGNHVNIVSVSSVDDGYELLKSGAIDVFSEDESTIEQLSSKSDIEIKSFFPLKYNEVSITTGISELKPIIDVIDKAIEAGGDEYLGTLYELGVQGNKKEQFRESLTARELKYFNAHVGKAIPVGLTPANYPISFYNTNDNMWSGISIDILSEISEITGLEFVAGNGPFDLWSDVLAKLKDGELPMSVELLKSDSRAGQFLWPSNSYAADQFALVSRSDTAKISANQVMTKNVGLLKGTVYTERFLEWFPNQKKYVGYDNINDAFDGLENGDIDLVMTTVNHLSGMTNYFERPDFIANLLFDYTSESFFGFNVNEPELCGIIEKAQNYVDTQAISEQWIRRVFDYQKKEAIDQNKRTLVLVVSLVAVMAMLGFLLFRRHGESKRLTNLVEERTVQLAEEKRNADEARQMAEAASETKSRFLSNMSHEMRTPLNAIIGLSELSLNYDATIEAARTSLEKIYNSGVTLLGIINDILDFNKIESGKFELIPVEYDLPSVVNDTVTLNIVRIGSKPIKFKTVVAPDSLSQLYGDNLRLKQIFNNLLSNAFKYTMEGEVIWSLGTKRDGDVVWIESSIKDTGIGIKEEDIGKLFAEYSQVNTASNRKIEGTGLGLTITKDLVQAMDGEIFVESVFGEGSTFTIRIKQGFITDKEIGPEIAEHLSNFKYSDSKREHHAGFVRHRMPYARVLVVDDVATNLDVARGMLRSYEMEIDAVMSGKAAISLIEKGEPKYSAIFMDHMMPEMDGIEATHIIRNEIGTDYAKNIPIIALTANAIRGNEQMFLENGFNAFISKPIDIVQMDSVIMSWVRDKEKENELGLDVHVSAQEDGAFAENDLVLNIEGLDVDVALGRTMGDTVAYLETLRTYANSTMDLLGAAEELLATDLYEYSVIVHGIKGSSYAVGAEAVGKKAEALEHAAKNGDRAFVNSNHDDFSLSVKKLLEALKNYFDRQESGKPLRAKPDAELLRKLVEAGKIYDIDTVDEIVEQLDEFEYSEAPDFMDELKLKVIRSDFSNIALE